VPRAAAARGLARRLRECGVIVFAEGTTGGAPLPAPFFDGLFRLLHRLAVPVVPVTIRYGDRRAYWVDPRGIAEHLRGVLEPRGLDAAVHIGAAIAPTASRDAGALGAALHAAVSAPILAHGELA
jgi:1-acyl-sn-glycerol-3-phosphate acyltransferase